MPEPPAFPTSPRNLALAGLSALLLLAAFACTGAPGSTPDCKPDTSEAGITPTPGGCDGFAQCLDDKGKPADAREVCCKKIEGSELENCLFGYGAGPAPGGGSSAASGSTGSSTSSASGSSSTSSASGSSSTSSGAGGG
jgi:hypothetical protein